ncbi:pseudouridine synthase [Cardiobacteriaceae bacterium TAE3-ERU3]|nr:pseudouridine synthase [Cardiobacteriaceae bacterium TAE3-ERU3]
MKRRHFFYPAPGRKLLVLNKPYGVLCQFSDGDGRATLKDYVDIAGVYPAGRLDRDSEGLVVLTDDGKLQARIADPKFKLEKTYYVEVEREPEEAALEQLRQGVRLKDGMTAPAKVSRIDIPDLWPRDPPVRFRKNVPTAWISISIREGRNRQVRRMTAAIGYPTLRLVRVKVGSVAVGGLSLGEYRFIDRI